MPFIPETQIETAALCNLRQVLQWLKDDIKPVDAHLEAIRGIPSSIYSPRYDVEKRQFFPSVLAQRINLFGRPGLGKFWADYRSGLEFESYGEYEQIPASKLSQGGLGALDFDSSSFGAVTAWDDVYCPL